MSEPPPAGCPRCGRPVAISRPRCLYCGAPLPEAASSPTPAAPSTELAAGGDAGPARALLILDAAAEPPRLAAALGLRPFEAEQLARRGGLHLHRALARDEAQSEERRLSAAGLVVTLVSESEARVAPIVAIRGRREKGELSLRHAGGELHLGAGDLLMVVRGPITREYQAAQEWRRVRSATLEPGYRFHLHRLLDPRPVELDPGAFELGAGAPEPSALLTLTAWVEDLAAGVPTDDHFRRMPPALGAASPEAGGAPSAAAGLRHRGGRDKDASLVLDNLAQFRFYSGWRAAVERRRRGLG